ncbi:MAG: protein kinase [Thermoanaerobaculia bacterium]
MSDPSIIPYVVGQWVRGERFYGRQAHLQEILEGSRESLWLLGTRRIGKTSLLRQLEWIASSSPDLGYLPLFWDLQGAEDPAELHLSFHDALLDSEQRWSDLGIEVSNLDPEDLFASLTRLRRQIRIAGRRLLLLCDEVEELIKLHQADASLLSKLRRSMQSGGEMRVVLASTIRLWALAEQRVDTSPFLLGFSPPLYLSSLEDEEARSLVAQEHLSKNLRPDLTEPELSRICEDCANHPYLLQLVSKRYLESGDLELAFEEVLSDDMVTHFFAVDFEMLSAAEKKVLIALRHTHEVQLNTLTEDPADSHSVEGSLLRLEELGFLRQRAPKTYTIANRFFRQWLDQLPEGEHPDTTQAPARGDFQDFEGGSRDHDLVDGRYTLLKQIGEGGMGRVFLASDRLLRAPVAIKILRPEFSEDPQILERFRREIILSRDLGHPNVLRIYHLGQDQSRRYLTMQWVKGQTLGQLLAETGALTESQVLKIAIKLTSALEAAHGRGVLHRDVKPQNVLLDGESEPFLTDFGLARELNDPGITSAGMFLGTPNYVSPEQASAHPLDERSDLYSFGVVLFEMATGRRPFEADSAAEVLHAHRSTPPPDPRSLVPDLSLGLSSIILRCLDKSPDDRFDSATQLRQALEGLNTAPDSSLV